MEQALRDLIAVEIARGVRPEAIRIEFAGHKWAWSPVLKRWDRELR